MRVYLIGSSEGYCKIGVANNTASRLAQLDSTKLPFELTLLADCDAGDAARQVESKLHRYFKSRHVRGEWFRMVPVEEFLNKAKQYTEGYVPRPTRESKPDIYAGKPWGSMSATQRGKFLRVAASVPEDIREEMHCYGRSLALETTNRHCLARLNPVSLRCQQNLEAFAPSTLSRSTAFGSTRSFRQARYRLEKEVA